MAGKPISPLTLEDVEKAGTSFGSTGFVGAPVPVRTIGTRAKPDPFAAEPPLLHLMVKVMATVPPALTTP